jgi:homoserine kinase type II
MARYSKLLATEIQEIAARFELRVSDYAAIDEGASNSSYLIRTNRGKFFLTVFEISLVRVTIINELLLLLEEFGFPTTRLLRKSNGNTISFYQDKPVLFKPFIAGQVRKNFSEAQLSQIGAALARLHQIPTPIYLPNEHAYGLQTFPDLFDHGIDPAYEYWLNQTYDYLKENIPPVLPRGLIHGDLFFDNVLVENGQFKSIIDFEEACDYALIFDLGMGIVGLCAEGTGINWQKAKAFISGYQQIRRLEPPEKAIFQIMIAYAAAATSLWRFWKYNIDTPNPDKANKQWEMAGIAKNALAIPESVFLDVMKNHQT